MPSLTKAEQQLGLLSEFNQVILPIMKNHMIMATLIIVPPMYNLQRFHRSLGNRKMKKVSGYPIRVSGLQYSL